MPGQVPPEQGHSHRQTGKGDYDPWRAASSLHCRRLAVGCSVKEGFPLDRPRWPRGLPSVLGGPRLAPRRLALGGKGTQGGSAAGRAQVCGPQGQSCSEGLSMGASVLEGGAG